MDLHISTVSNSKSFSSLQILSTSDLTFVSTPKRSLSATSKLSAFAPNSKRSCLRNAQVRRPQSVPPINQEHAHMFDVDVIHDKNSLVTPPYGLFRPIQEEHVHLKTKLPSVEVSLTKPEIIAPSFSSLSSVEFSEGSAPAPAKDRRSGGRRGFCCRPQRVRSLNHREIRDVASPSTSASTWKEFCFGEGLELEDAELWNIYRGCKSALSEAITDSEWTGSSCLTNSLSAMSSRTSLRGISGLGLEIDDVDGGLTACSHSVSSTSFYDSTGGMAQLSFEPHPRSSSSVAKHTRFTPLIEQFSVCSLSKPTLIPLNHGEPADSCLRTESCQVGPPIVDYN